MVPKPYLCTLIELGVPPSWASNWPPRSIPDEGQGCPL